MKSRLNLASKKSLKHNTSEGRVSASSCPHGKSPWADDGMSRNRNDMEEIIMKIREKSLLWRLEQVIVITVLSTGLLAVGLVPALACEAIKDALLSLL